MECATASPRGSDKGTAKTGLPFPVYRYAKLQNANHAEYEDIRTALQCIRKA